MLPRVLVFALLPLLSGDLWAADLPALPDWAIARAARLGRPTDCGRAERTVRASSFEVVVRPHRDVRVHGRSRSGAAWHVAAEYPGDGGCRLFVHDLDGNGTHDLVLLTANGGSGPAGVTMTVVAFDGQGRPVPWQATGAFTLQGARVLNFVDLNGDGRHELLFQHVEEHGMDRQTSVSTALYTINDGHFLRVDGRFGGRRFPIRQPARVRLLDEPDLTNALRGGDVEGRAATLRQADGGPCWLQGITLTGDGIALAPDSPAAEECRGYLSFSGAGRLRTPLITVLDLPDGGRLIDINLSLDLLRQAVASKLRVSLSGRSCETGCRPFVMWART